MPSQDSFGAKGTLDVGGKAYEIFRLSAVTGDGVDVESLPYSLKVLLENLLRTEDGANITADDIKALAGWDAGEVLHDHARRLELDLLAGVGVRVPAGQCLDVVLGDVRAVLGAQPVSYTHLTLPTN